MSTLEHLNFTKTFITDTATLLIADPAVLTHYVHEAVDWWAGEFTDIPEVKHGKISLVSLGHDGSFKIRFTGSKLKASEKTFAREKIVAGLTVKSQRIFIGQGEAISGGGVDLAAVKLGNQQGIFIDLANGFYQLEIYSIDVRFAVEDDAIKSVSNMADIVIILSPSSQEIPGVSETPRLFVNQETFLFESKKKRGILKMGIVGEVSVFKVPASPSGKALKMSGINWPSRYYGYRLLLEDMSVVQWKDKLRVQSEYADEENKIIYFKLIEKLN